MKNEDDEVYDPSEDNNGWTENPIGQIPYSPPDPLQEPQEAENE